MPKQNDVSHYKTTSTLDKQSKQEENLHPCVKYVKECWENWSEHWSSRFNDFEEYYDRWMGKPPSRDEDWQANFHKRLTWQAEKTLVARNHSAIFPTSAPIDGEATGVEDEFPKILGKSLVAHWFKVGKFSKEFLSAMRSAGIYGTGLFEDEWYQRVEEIYEKEETEIPQYSPMVDEFGNKILDESGNIRVMQNGTRKTLKEKARKRVVEDRYRVKKANIFSWRVHPNKLDDDDDYPAIKQEFITYDKLLERQAELEKYNLGGFDNLDEIKKDRFKIKDEDIKRLQKDGSFIDDKDPRLEILHYWGLYSEQEGEKDYNSNGEKRPMWIMVVNRRYLLKKTINPYWHKKPPLFHIVWTEDEKPSYYGIGLAQIGKSAEDRANITVNIRTDMKKKNVRGTGWYNATDKRIKKSHLTKNTPGFMRPCSDVNAAFRYDNPPTLTIEDYKEEETAVNDHREITGATTSILPTADVSEQHRTLGGMQLLVGQAAQRLRPDLVMMELMGIRKIANRAFLLSRQFMTKAETIELIASQSQLKQLGVNKIYQMTPEQIISKMDFYCTGLSETIDKAQNIDKLIKYAEVTGKIPALQAITNYQAIGKRIALWLGFEDVDDFVIGFNPNMPLQQMQQMMPQQQPMALPQQQPQGLPPEILQQIAQGLQTNQPGMV